MENNKKMVFVGKCKTIETKTGGEFTNIVINFDDILTLLSECLDTNFSEKVNSLAIGKNVAVVRLKLMKSKKTNERFICVDDWKPSFSYQEKVVGKNDDISEIPF